LIESANSWPSGPVVSVSQSMSIDITSLGFVVVRVPDQLNSTLNTFGLVFSVSTEHKRPNFK